MKLEFSLEAQDYLTHQLFLASINDRIKAKRTRGRIIVPAFYLVIAFLFYDPEHIGYTVMIGVLAILWLLFYPLYETKRYINHYEAFILENHKSNFGKPNHLEIQEDHLYARDRTSEAKVSFEEIQTIYELPAHYLVRLGSAQSFIIPKKQVDESELKTALERIAQQLSISIQDYRNWHWK